MSKRRKRSAAELNPPLAYEDRDFLNSDAARPLRIVSEYLHPFKAFHDQGVHDTIVFMGSARIRENGTLGRYYNEARILARWVTQWSKSLKTRSRRFIVCSGGGPGIMEAANRGAKDAHGRSIGLNIGLPHEQRPNPYITKGLSFEFHYFFMRKLWFAHLARAMVVFPGGFGTLDEFFEMLTLSQTRKLSRPILILLYGSSYWKEIINFDALVKHRVISPEDVSLFHFVDTPEEALLALQNDMEKKEGKPSDPAVAKSTTPHNQVGRARGAQQKQAR
jgi:uncharacterized protein (TIGR00730 family)